MDGARLLTQHRGMASDFLALSCVSHRSLFVMADGVLLPCVEHPLWCVGVWPVCGTSEV